MREIRSSGLMRGMWKRELQGLPRHIPTLPEFFVDPDIHKDDLGEKARAFLMSRLDATTRERWLADAKSENEKDDLTSPLIEGWAKWDPHSALEFAAAAKDPDIIKAAAAAACWLPWDVDNMRHCGLGALKNLNVFDLPEAIRGEATESWSQMVMEGWGEIDIGETARYGLDFMLRTNYAPRVSDHSKPASDYRN
jgi:hypothetical protein